MGHCPLAALLLLAPLLSGCAAHGPTPDVMATFYPLAYLAERIGGGNVTVGTIVKPGVEPHDYDPTITDLTAISEAKLVVVQGAGFETWVLRARQQAPDTRIAFATSNITLHKNDVPEGGLLLDPHTWVDPPLYAKMARTVEAAMAAAFPDKAAGFHARADALVADLGKLDAEFRAGLAHCETPHAITGHAAFGYLAATYRFEQVAIEGLNPDAEPDPATLNHVIDAARRYNVTIVFFEDLVNPALANAIAKEVHAQTRVLSPLEAIAPGKLAAGADYFSVQRENLANLREAMRCA